MNNSIPSIGSNGTAKSIIIRALSWRVAIWLIILLPCLALQPRTLAARAQLLVGNLNDNSVVSYDGTTGVFHKVFVTPGSGGLSGPQNLIIGPDGNLYVSSHDTDSVKRYDRRTGAFIDDFVPSGSGGLSAPDQLAFGPDHNLYVSNRFNATITRYDGRTGAFIDIFVSDFRLSGFTGFTFGPDGRIYAGEFNFAHDILRFARKSGRFNGIFNSGNPFLDAAVTGLTFGPDGNLYAARWIANLVERYDGATGAFIDTFVTAGSGGLNTADYLIFGPDGDLYVAGLGNGAILRYDGTTGAFKEVFTKGGPPLLPKGLVFVSRPEQGCLPPPPDLIAWYPGDGNADDIQGGNNGMLVNGTTFAPGMVDEAFSFDGVDDSVVVPHNDNQNTGNQITIDAWVNPSSAGHGRPIANKRTPGNVGYTFETTHSPFGPDNGLNFSFTVGGVFRTLIVGDVLTLGAFQHVAATYDGTIMRIYVNGVEKANVAASGTIDSLTDPFVIGHNVVATSFNWQGLIDEVELFNRALSQSEIQAIVDAGSAGKCK